MQDFSGPINLHLLLSFALKKLAMQVEAFEVTIKMKQLGFLSTFLACAGLGFVSMSNLLLALPSQDGSTSCWQIENGWQWRCAKSGHPADELLIHNRSHERVLFDVDT